MLVICDGILWLHYQLNISIIIVEDVMHTINIRNLDDSVYEEIKKESKNKGISINKFLVRALSELFGKKKETEYHDLDNFFGTWTKEEYNNVMQASKDSRKIDEDLWK